MYEKFYGFSAKPFQMNPDPRFLYMTPTHQGAMFSMIAGIRDGKGITVVTGEVGTGKTTLVYALLSGLTEKIRTAFIFHTTTGFRDLLRNILQDLGEEIVEDNLSSLIIQFDRYRERMARHETVAIVIDEGQNLRVDVIESLFRLFVRKSASDKRIQILLIGQPELEPKLDAIELQAFKDRVTTRYRIDPLSENECFEYIDHRLKVVGSSGPSIFEPQTIRQIWKFSRGIPRIINTLCDRALVNGYIASRKVIDGKIARETLREMSYLSPKAGTFPRRLAFLRAVLAVALACTLGLAAQQALKRDGGSAPSPAPEAVVEKAVSMRAKIEKQNQPQAVEPEKTDTVKKGRTLQTLSYLAQQHYGLVNPTVLDILLEHNPQITDVNRIPADRPITFPPLTEKRFLGRDPDGRHRIYLGTFGDRKSIRTLKKHPLLKGKAFKITPRKVSIDGLFYRVTAIGFKSKKEALHVLHGLKQHGLLPAFAASAG